LKNKEINNLPKFLSGFVLLLAGFVIIVRNFPEKIWFLGLGILIIGIILISPFSHYFIPGNAKKDKKSIKISGKSYHRAKNKNP